MGKRKFMLGLGRMGAGSLVFLSALASAQSFYWQKDSYLFRIDTDSTSAPAFWSDDYLIVGSSGNATRPSRYAWGDQSPRQRLAGFSTKKDLTDNAQAVWNKYTLFESGKFQGSIFVTGRISPYVVLEVRKPGEAVGRCLASDTDGNIFIPSIERKQGSVPSPEGDVIGTLSYAAATVCGWTAQEMLDNNRFLWSMKNSTIESARTQKCIRFGNSGLDMAASLYRWPEGGDYCGRPLASNLRTDGQALFEMIDVKTLPPY
jgi:hypothetical protein